MHPISDSDPITPPDRLGPSRHGDERGGALGSARRSERRDLVRERPDGARQDAGVTEGVASEPSQQAREELADERMAFLSFAAHELRGPLTAVKGYAQLALIAARKDATFPERSRRALHAIDQQTTRMADMVAELLDATRIQRGAFEVRPRLIELNMLVQHAVEQRIVALEHHTVELDMGRETLVGMWDALRIEQTVRDLLDNAVRYSPSGGVIRVRLERAGAMARLWVSDPGIGVPEDERERIFEAFFHGTNAEARHLSGLGLGLFVGRTVAERLGGRLWLEPSGAEESGSRFCLELPLANAS